MTLEDKLRAALMAPRGDDLVLLSGDHDDIAASSPSPGIAAAVLVAITDRPAPGVILTRRTEHLANHPGQIAFPGGRIDPGDTDAQAAALREAQEEIGLDPKLVRIVGRADRYRTVTSFAVIPIVAVVPPDLTYAPSPGEVADVFEVPLDHVLDPANHVEARGEWRGRQRRFYQIDWQGRSIWGATAAMLINLSRRLRWTA